MKLTTCIAAWLLACCGLCAAQNAAQQPSASPSPTPNAAQRDPQSNGAPDVDLAITANVTAKELRFDEVPNPKVEFTGKPERVTVWNAERQNLPRPVQPGVTYRDIGVQLKITSVFADIDRIVAEALGEVPVSDDAQPSGAPSNNSPPRQRNAPNQTTPPPSASERRPPR